MEEGHKITALFKGEGDKHTRLSEGDGHEIMYPPPIPTRSNTNLNNVSIVEQGWFSLIIITTVSAREYINSMH